MAANRDEFDPETYGAKCGECPLRHKSPIRPVGPDDASLVVVGDAPGMQEEMKGWAFAGPAGDLFHKMLGEAGIARERVWITAAILCRPETPGEKGRRRYDVKTFVAWIRSANAKAKKLAKAQKREPHLVTSPFDACRPRLLAEIKYFEELARRRKQPNGAVVVPMGNFALIALTGKGGVMKRRGAPEVLAKLPWERP